MRKLTLTLSAAALALTGSTAALADHHGGKRGPDADGDGVVSLAEHNAHSAAMFEKMDANGDGVINAADREARKAERFARVDTDGSGELSQEELTAAREARKAKMEQRRAQMGERAGERGERMAKRGGEGGEHHGKRGGRHGKRGGPGMIMLKQADANGDKQVTRAEFNAAAADHFRKMDTDNSGSVSKEEREAARAAMKARMEERRAARQAG